MSRYVIQRQVPRASWLDVSPAPLPHPQVFVSDPVDTGLLDRDGNKIMRVADRVGFLRPTDNT